MPLFNFSKPQVAKKVVLAFIVLELFLITFLLLSIVKKTGVERIIPIPVNKDDINFNLGSFFKNYYEPKSNSKIVKTIEGKVYSYSINSDSLNENSEYTIKKDQNVFRIIALGDSYTFGLYVNTEDNWTALLESKLNNSLKCKKNKKFEIINLGVYGYDIQFSSERFRLRGRKYDPDLVLWFIKKDDLLQITDLVVENSAIITKDNKSISIFKNNNKLFDINGVLWDEAVIKIHNNVSKKILLDLQQNSLSKFKDYSGTPYYIYISKFGKRI